MNSFELATILHALGMGDTLLGELLDINPQRVKAWRHGRDVIPPHMAKWATMAMRRVNDQACILADRCPSQLILWPSQQDYDDFAYTIGEWWEWNAVARAVYRQSLSWPSGAVGMVEFDCWLYTAWLGDKPHSKANLEAWAKWWHECPIRVVKAQVDDNGELVAKLCVQLPEGRLRIIRKPLGISATDDEGQAALAMAVIEAANGFLDGGDCHEATA